MTTATRLPGGVRDPRLTQRRLKILDCIHESVERRGYPPSMREIADAVGLKSTSAVSYQLKILERMGHLTRDARTPRTVVEKPSRRRVLQEFQARCLRAGVTAEFVAPFWRDTPDLAESLPPLATPAAPVLAAEAHLIPAGIGSERAQ